MFIKKTIMIQLDLNNDNEILLKSSEVKKLLKITAPTLYVWINTGILKSYRIGEKTIRFKKSDILEILKPNLK